MIVSKKTTLLSIALIALFSLALSASADTSNSRVLEQDRAVVSVESDVELDLGEIDDLDESLDDIDKTLSDLEKKLDDVEDVDDSDDDRPKCDDVRSKCGGYSNDMTDIMTKLSKIALDDDGVGDDIDEVVKEQRELEKKAAKALDEVEKRDGLKTFFFGTDYKNLGELRSTLVTTENHIERLMRAASSTTDASVKANLMVQIQALENTASSTEVFIRDNEGKFSLFGWFVRVFQK